MSSDFEDRLRELLARTAETHEPGETLGRIEGLARRRGRLRRVSLLAGGALVLGGAGVAAGLLVGSHATRQEVRTVSPPTAAANAQSSWDVVCDAGASGKQAWVVTPRGFFVTDDQGGHWSTMSLPATCPAVRDQSGALWLLAAQGNTALLYRPAGPGGSWTKTAVTLTWPPAAPQGPLVPPSERSAAFGSDAPGVVSAVITEGGAKTGPVAVVLVSGDDGRTFHQHDPPKLFGSWASGFTSASDGVLVGTGYSTGGGGRPGAEVYHTADGGASWSLAKLPELPAASSLGAPVVDGSRIYITASVFSENRHLSRLYASSDGGATFTLAYSFADHTNADPPVVAVSGSNLWLVPDNGSRVFESPNGGSTWTKVQAPSLSGGSAGTTLIGSIGLSGEVDATAWLYYYGGCIGRTKVGCVSSRFLVATTDSGHHWRKEPIPSTASAPTTTEASTTPGNP